MPRTTPLSPPVRPVQAPASTAVPATGWVAEAAGAGLPNVRRLVERALHTSLRFERPHGDTQGPMLGELAGLGLDRLLQAGGDAGASAVVSDALISRYLNDRGNSVPGVIRERWQAGEDFDALVEAWAPAIANELLADLGIRHLDPETRRTLAAAYGGRDGRPSADALERYMARRVDALAYVDGLVPPRPERPAAPAGWDKVKSPAAAPADPLMPNGFTPAGPALERLQRFKDEDPMGYRRFLERKGLLDKGKDPLSPPAARPPAVAPAKPPAAPPSAPASGSDGQRIFTCQDGSAQGWTAAEACQGRGGPENNSER